MTQYAESMPIYINDALSLNEVCPILIQRLHCTYKCQMLTSASSGNKLQTDSVTKTMLEYSYRNNYFKILFQIIFFKCSFLKDKHFSPLPPSFLQAMQDGFFFFKEKTTLFFFSRPMIYVSLFNINTILELRNV